MQADRFVRRALLVARCEPIGLELTPHLGQMSAETLRRANEVAKIDVVEMSWSPYETGIEVGGQRFS